MDEGNSKVDRLACAALQIAIDEVFESNTARTGTVRTGIWFEWTTKF